MIVTVFKGNFPKRDPKLINYSDYWKFDIDNFRKNAYSELSNHIPADIVNLFTFDSAVKTVLSEHDPIKVLMHPIFRNLTSCSF